MPIELGHVVALGGAGTAVNAARAYDRLSSAGSVWDAERRWIGKCKKCDRTHKIEGHLKVGHGGGRHDYVIQSNDGRLYATALHGSDVSSVWVPCGEHQCLLRRVHEGTKRSKHECGARCTNATGPNCDCRCRGKNHGSNC